MYSLEPALVSARQLSMFFHSPSRQIQTQKVRYRLAPLSLPFSIMRLKAKDSNPFLALCMTLDKLQPKNNVFQYKEKMIILCFKWDLSVCMVFHSTPTASTLRVLEVMWCNLIFSYLKLMHTDLYHFNINCWYIKQVQTTFDNYSDL